MKNIIYTCFLLLFLSACQSTQVEETIQPSFDEDSCIDKFESVNNQQATAPAFPLSAQSDWLFLSKNDKDYWTLTVKADEKGKIPTKLTYSISAVCVVRVSVIRKEDPIVRPKTMMTFRQNISESIVIDDLKIGETVTVLMEYVGGEPTCYNLSLTQ
jgi:hypothetical protein